VLALDEHIDAVSELARLGVEQPAILEQHEHDPISSALACASLPRRNGAAQWSDIGKRYRTAIAL
jgi:hypothetical protein